MTIKAQQMSLADLAADRGLRLKDLGPPSTMRLYNQGISLPGPFGLRRMAKALDMQPQEVMAVCRATVARREESRATPAKAKA